MKARDSARRLLLLVALAAATMACDDFVLRTLDGGRRRLGVGRQPADQSRLDHPAADRRRHLTAKGGSGSYTFSLVNPIGGSSIVAGTGYYVASATATEPRRSGSRTAPVRRAARR